MKPARHMRISSILAAALFLFGCGNLKARDNNALYSAYSDPTVIGSVMNQMTTFYYNTARCQTGLGAGVADVMWYYSNADFAVINAGSVRWNPPAADVTASYLFPGAVTKGDVDRFLPYDNLTGTGRATNPSSVFLVSLTGAVIKQMFENGFSRMDSSGLPTTSYGRFLQVSNTLHVHADVTKPVGARITGIALNGAAIDLADTTTKYRVAVPQKYIKNAAGFSDSDGYWDILAQGTNIIDTKKYIYTLVVDAIIHFSPLNWTDGYCDIPGGRFDITHN